MTGGVRAGTQKNERRMKRPTKASTASTRDKNKTVLLEREGITVEVESSTKGKGEGHSWMPLEPSVVFSIERVGRL